MFAKLPSCQHEVIDWIEELISSKHLERCPIVYSMSPIRLDLMPKVVVH